MLPLGTRVCSPKGDDCKFRGMVEGYGFLGTTPVLLIRLDNGGYLNSKVTYCYISTMIVLRENVELE
jgi:hypothetical protein